MYNVFNNVKNSLNYYKMVESYSFINNLVDTYNFYYEYKLEENDKTNDLKIIFNEYEKELFNNNFLTPNMLYKEVIKKTLFNGKYLFLDLDNIKEKDLSLIKKMSLDGEVLLVLDDINNNYLKKVIENKFKTYVNLNEVSLKNKVVDYKKLNDISDEVSFVSNDIAKKIYLGYKYDDILIVTPNKETYLPYINLYLNHPHLSYEQKGLLTNRFIKLFCDILNGDFSCSKFIEILKLNIFDVDLNLIDKLDNYIYSWNLEDKSFYIPFNYNPNGNKKSFSNKDLEDLKVLNNLKDEIINPIKYLLENIVGNNSKTDILKNIYIYLTEEKIIDKLFKEDEDGVNNLIMLLENIDDYLIENSELDEIVNIIYNSTLNSVKKIDMKKSISICTFDDAIYEDKKIIYIMGMILGDFPLAFNFTSLISKDDITKESLLEALECNSASCYHNFSKALNNKNVIITYPKLGIDLKLTEKSSYLEDLNLKEIEDDKIYDKNELLKKYSILLSENKINMNDDIIFKRINKSNLHDLNYTVDKSITKKFYNNEISLNPSSIESFSKCPFYYFCEYTLKLKQKEKYIFDNREVGTFIHSILENILKNEMNSISLDNIEEKVLKYSKTYLYDNGKILNNTVNYTLNNLSMNICKVIKNIINELDISSFKPYLFEIKVGDDIIKPLVIKKDGIYTKVSGIIDRLDVYEDDNNFYYRIIDYKTGEKKFRLDDILDGLNLQMLIYLLVIRESNLTDLNIIPSAILYYTALVKDKISSRSLTSEEKDETIKDRLKMNGILNNTCKFLIENEDEKDYINITTRKSIDSEKLYSMDNLNLLFKSVKNTLNNISKKILDGNINVNPIGGRIDSCLYCRYKSICKFDDIVDKKRNPSNYKNSEVIIMLEGDKNA